MLLSVDPSLPLPVYEQICEQIRRMVAAGTLRPGHRLPTIRQLATDLGLAKGTVARAYELLESDSIIATRGRQGSFVVDPPTTTAANRTAALARAAEGLVVVAKQLGADLDDAHRSLDRAWRRF
ncbi:MAG: GntR family transcriptional regulator [Acidimicrobiia bacterium]